MFEIEPGDLAFERYGGGEVLELDAYRADFREYRRRVRGEDSWKLERRQHFEETSAGRDALRRNDWSAAMEILEGRRAEFTRTVEEDRVRGTSFRRVRIVGEPLSPYLRWELQSLRVQAECGKPVRVVPDHVVSDLESAGPLPEVVVLGEQALYRVLYSDTGVLEGGVRYLDREVIRSWRDLIARLFGMGEDVVEFVGRREDLQGLT